MRGDYTVVAVPLAGGIDTKTDHKAVLPTKLVVLENGEFTKGGSVRKRWGHAGVQPLLNSNTAVSGLRNVLSRADECVVAGRDALYSYDSRTSRLLQAGTYCAFTHTALEATKVSAQQTRPDMASNNGMTVYAWEDSRGGIRASLYNTETGAPQSVDFSVAASNARYPRCVAVGASLIILYADTSTNNLMAKVLNTTDITASLAASAVILVEDLAASSIYDAVGSDDYGYLLYATDGIVVTGTRLCRFNGSASAVLFSSTNPVTSTVASAVALAYSADNDQVTGAVYNSGSTAVDQFRVGSDMVVAATSSGTEASVTNLATAQVTAGSLGVLFKEKSAGSSSNYTIEISQSGVSDITVRHLGLASSAFVVGDYAYVLAAHHSRTGLQNNYYLLRSDGKVVGRVLTGEGAGLASSMLPRVGADYTLALPFQRKLSVRDVSSVVPTTVAFAHKGIKHVSFDVDATPRGDELDGTLYLSGSQLWAYDGSQAVESGFHMFPDVLTSDITVTGAAGSLPTSGTVSYRVYYEFSLANGQRFRSAAITRVSPTLNGNKVQLVIPTLSCTLKGASVSIVVTRTEQNGQVFYYRVSSSDPTTAGTDNGYLANDPTVDSVTFTDNMSDAVLIDGTHELDYLSYGEKPNFAPEGPENVTVAQGRLWLCGGGQRPNNVKYSKLKFDGEPVEFAGFEVTEAPDYGGRTMAVSHLGEAVVVFKERACYAVDGIGPDNTGGGGAYTPRPLSSDMGCTEPGGVLPYSEGIIFKSPEGFQQLNPDGSFSYIGAEAEAYNDQVCTAATSVPDTNHLVFLMASGKTLLYDTFYRQWSTFTNHTGLGACVWKGDTYVYLRADGYLMIRDELYADAGVSYSLRFKTAPLRLLDVLQGFWRVVDLGVLGEYVSSHLLRVGVYYDRQQAPYYTFDWNPDDVLELTEWGDGSWGDGLWGGSVATRDYRFEHKFKRQKCETVSLEFTDISTGAPLGASFEITELALGVRARKGMGRIAASRKI